MTKRGLLVLPLFLLVCSSAWAEQDFYGIQMRNEIWAKNLVFQQGAPGDPADLKLGPVLRHEVHAEASLKEVTPGHLDLRVTVFNDSAAPLSTDYDMRDFFVYARDGKKYPLIDPDEMPGPQALDPRSKGTFTPSLGNLPVTNSDVMMIECSFDLGRTKLFLFPWSKKETVTKLVSPALPPEPAPPAPKGRAPMGPKKGTKRNFWDWLGLEKMKKKEPVKPTAVEKVTPEKTVTPATFAPSRDASVSAPPAAAADTQSKLQSAIKNFVYVPASGITGPHEAAPAAAPSSAGASAAAGSAGTSAPAAQAAETSGEPHVIEFNKNYNFVTLNLGTRNGLTKNTMLAIVRDGKLVAKARIKQLRESVSAASVIPETVRSEVRPGDKVTLV